MAIPPTRLDELRRWNFDSLCATRRALRPLALVCRRLHVLSMPFLHSTVVLKNIVRTADTAISSVKEVRDLTDMPGEPSLGLFCRDLVLDMQTSWSMGTFSYLREPAAEMIDCACKTSQLEERDDSGSLRSPPHKFLLGSPGSRLYGYAPFARGPYDWGFADSLCAVCARDHREQSHEKNQEADAVFALSRVCPKVSRGNEGTVLPTWGNFC
jgi:hypothetical protein